MKDLLPLAEKVAIELIARKQTIGVAESSTGGLISAALLAVPGASAYFIGGGVIYTLVLRALCATPGGADSRAAGLRLGTVGNGRHGAIGQPLW